MAYGTPSNPVSGTVITVAYAVANILDPIRWLRLLTGNADPPGSSYVVVSTSTSGTTWAKVTADVLAAGAVASSLGYTPANKGGDTFTGPVSVPTFLTVLKIDDAGNGGRIRLQGSSGYVHAILENTTSNVLLYNESDLTKLVQFSLVTGLLTLPGAVSAVTAAISGLLTAASATISGALSAASAAISGNATVGGTLGVTGTSTLAAVNSGAVTSSGAVQGTRLIATVSDGTTPPLSIHANQINVTVPNLKAASADVAALAVTATNAQLLDSIDSTGFALAGHTHTYAQIASGSYTGNGAASQNIALAFTPKLVFIQRLGTAHWLSSGPSGQAIQINVGGTPGETALAMPANAFTAAVTSGTNTNAVTYYYVAIG